MKNFFNKYWYGFLDFAEYRNLIIRSVVHLDIIRMIQYKTNVLCYSLFKCPECGKKKLVYNTCKSRFCISCVIKYAKRRTLNIESKLINSNIVICFLLFQISYTLYF